MVDHLTHRPTALDTGDRLNIPSPIPNALLRKAAVSDGDWVVACQSTLKKDKGKDDGRAKDLWTENTGHVDHGGF
jgi:hypothetical protein